VAIRVEDSTTVVPGFRFSGLAAGIKTTGRPDLALAVADQSVAAGGIFTTNFVRAAPVQVAADHLAGGRARAILVNSGCANACTGEAGLAATRETIGAVARALGVPPREIIPASTGVIGVTLPAARIVEHAPSLVAALSEHGADQFAEAILTTDRGPKVAHARGEIAGRPFVVMGIAKGAGMIHPHMAPLAPIAGRPKAGPSNANHATMLAFLFTDAAADAALLAPALTRIADATFHQASVDGDTSTNDTLVAMCSGRALGHFSSEPILAPPVEEAMTLVCEQLVRKIVADGEGAEHLVEIHVSGVASNEDAIRIARTIATSSLVKTALYGQDPNWGRLLAAAGRAGIAFDPAHARVFVGGVAIVEGGIGLGAEREAAAHDAMALPSYRIELVLGRGPGVGRYLTCDLGTGYVRCNADYRS